MPSVAFSNRTPILPAAAHNRLPAASRWFRGVGPASALAGRVLSSVSLMTIPRVSAVSLPVLPGFPIHPWRVAVVPVPSLFDWFWVTNGHAGYPSPSNRNVLRSGTQPRLPSLAAMSSRKISAWQLAHSHWMSNRRPWSLLRISA